MVSVGRGRDVAHTSVYVTLGGRHDVVPLLDELVLNDPLRLAFVVYLQLVRVMFDVLACRVMVVLLPFPASRVEDNRARRSD